MSDVQTIDILDLARRILRHATNEDGTLNEPLLTTLNTLFLVQALDRNTAAIKEQARIPVAPPKIAQIRRQPKGFIIP